jgi:hypothetical protein
MRHRTLRFFAPLMISIGIAVLMTWPLATGMDRLARTSGDGLYSVWNVAWVAHALTTSPSRLFEANIFYPDRIALAYSEANVVAGVIGIPGWLITRNAYVAHNTVVLFAFATAVLGAWLLARRLTGDPVAAAAAAVMYGFCPYLFAHTAHIQLLLCGGIPICLLLLHRLVDTPNVARGLALGLGLVLQSLACAYYGVFAGVVTAYGTIFFAVSRGLWRSRNYWLAIGSAAVTALSLLLPWFSPYLFLQSRGFGRTLEEATRYSANVQSYLASPAHLHRWLLALLDGGTPWTEVLFPGVMALALGLAGFVLLLRRRKELSGGAEIAWFYASIAAAAIWISFGPDAGAYRVLSNIPVFSFLRAPARFGLLVPLALSVLAAFAISRLVDPLPSAARLLACSAIAAAALFELHVAPFRWEPALPPSPAYQTLAKMPRGPLAVFPFYSDRPAYPMHTRYMVYSTIHWQPLLNGYSDFIPARFRRESSVLNSFPSQDSFEVLRKWRVRYISLHWPRYGAGEEDVREKLEHYKPYLRVVAEDERVSVYEIKGFP